MGSGIASQATAEPAGQPHQMGLIQGLIASRQLSPPQPESTGAVTQAEVSIQQDPIYTVITACHNILIQCAQSIAHAAHPTRTTPCFATAPCGGHFFTAQSAKKLTLLHGPRRNPCRTRRSFR